MAYRKLLLTKQQLAQIKEVRRKDVTEEQFDKWVEDCVELVKDFW